MLTRKFILKKGGQFLLHAFFWGFVLLFFTSFFGHETTNFSYVLTFSLFLMPITIITTYVSIYILIPDYLIKKRYFLFGLYSIYTLIISGYLIIASIFFGLVYYSNFNYGNMLPISRSILLVMVAVYLVVVVVSAFKSLKLNLKNTEKTSLLETKIIETQLKLKEQELHYLKMQIHPHFLFNTLNTLYGFALKKADETPEAILKLSNLLDYLLYQIDKPFVPLTAEINHIQDYIALEKLRFNDSLCVNFKQEGILENAQIAPMLLLTFIENSFKHGHLREGILDISIYLSCNAESIQFCVENTANNASESKKGIGLENSKKRLEILYPNKHDLHIENENQLFHVNLELKR